MANGFPTLKLPFNLGDLGLAAVGALLLLAETPIYGVFNTDNKKVLEPNTITSMEFKHEWRISDFPLEKGGFASFNKVNTPADARVRMVVGGPIYAYVGDTSQGATSVERQAMFLATLEKLAGSLELLWVVTPQAVYVDMCVSHYDYRRTTTNGVGLLTVDVWLQEVRQVYTGTSATTAKASGASPQVTGNVQGSTADPVTTTTVQGSIQ